MPTDMDKRFHPEDFRDVKLAGPFSFTKGAKVMRIHRASGYNKPCAPFDLLFDLQSAPTRNTILSTMKNARSWPTACSD